jgi:hypothetical protein
MEAPARPDADGSMEPIASESSRTQLETERVRDQHIPKRAGFVSDALRGQSDPPSPTLSQGKCARVNRHFSVPQSRTQESNRKPSPWTSATRAAPQLPRSRRSSARQTGPDSDRVTVCPDARDPNRTAPVEKIPHEHDAWTRVPEEVHPASSLSSIASLLAISSTV